METNNSTQAGKRRALIIKLLEVVNSREEYHYLQKVLTLVTAEFAHFPPRSISVRRCD
jgi:hypothetical protein